MMLTETAAADERVTLHELLERSEKLALDSVANRPDLQGSVLDMIASFYMSFGSYGKAESLLRQAGDLVRGSRDMTLRARIECNHALAQSELGNVEVARRTIETWLAHPDVEPHVAALCQQYLAQIARNHQDAQGALANALGAMARFQSAKRVMPGFEASLTGDIAYAYYLNGRMDEAERHYARAVEMMCDLGRGESPTAVAVRSNWALACTGAGDVKRGLALIDDVLDIVARRTPGGTPPPYLVNNRASSLLILGRYAEAQAECERSRRIAENAGAAVFALNARVMQARIEAERGDLDGAAHALAALRDEAAALPEDSFSVLGLRVALAQVALRRGDAHEAATTIEPVVRFYESRGTRTGMRAMALRVRAEARWACGDLDAAMADATAALALAEELRGSRPASNVSGLCALLVARLEAARGRAREASAARNHAIAQLTAALGPAHPETQRAARACCAPRSSRLTDRPSQPAARVRSTRECPHSSRIRVEWVEMPFTQEAGRGGHALARILGCSGADFSIRRQVVPAHPDGANGGNTMNRIARMAFALSALLLVLVRTGGRAAGRPP